MNENPIQLVKEELFYYPFRVCYVYLNTADKHDPAFKAVKEFCDSHHIPIYSRVYDSRKYDEDCEEIQELPAFHMYTQGMNYPEETFYPTTHPLQKINAYILKWEIELERAEYRRREREARKQGVISFFKNLFVKKTRMEKIAEQVLKCHEEHRLPQDVHYRK
jgi:hypothetical protein